MLVSYNSNSMENNVRDHGIITLMYHRFEENKYPSTNIRIKDFISHINMIKKEKIKFVNPNEFSKNITNKKEERKVLITIDDGFLSFYKNAWPFLKKNEIPFILFVSTKEVGNYGYMTWSQIREISKVKFVYIGNHSHSHEYLVDEKIDYIKADLLKSKSIFKKELGISSEFFSYPFGEYSLKFKNLVKNLGFKYAFGQHSGVVDETKDYLELPRFPINEKYGELKRFSTLLRTIPLKYISIIPEEKYINDTTNPPNVQIKFFKDQNLKMINCFSNEEDEWRASKIELIKENILKINLVGKFTTERGRINCSLKEKNGFYRWMGIQFVVSEIK